MILALAIACGLGNAAIAVFHLLFASLFGWKRALPRLDPTNRAIMLVMNLSIAAIFALLSLYAFAIAAGLLPLDSGARATLAGVALFALLRAAMQPLYFGLAARGSGAFFVAILAGAALHAALALA